jgi:hypothetical protein
MNNIHEDLEILDQLHEGVDWFKMIDESQIAVAKRIKATPTDVLKKIIISESADSKRQMAKKELALRTASDNANADGDSRYSNGYTIESDLNEDVRLSLAETIASLSQLNSDKDKKQIIDEALQSFYDVQNASLNDRRKSQIVSLATRSSDSGIIAMFINENPEIHTQAILHIKESFDEFKKNLVESKFTVGSKEKVQCVISYGAIRVGDIFDAIWVQSPMPNQLRLDMEGIPRATRHPSIFFNQNTKQLEIQKHFKLL